MGQAGVHFFSVGDRALRTIIGLPPSHTEPGDLTTEPICPSLPQEKQASPSPMPPASALLAEGPSPGWQAGRRLSEHKMLGRDMRFPTS